MHEQKIYRHCPESHNKPCFNSLCDHQCFMQEKESREPEKPQSEKTWEEILKMFDGAPRYYASSNATNQPIHIHVHNDFGQLLEVLLSINQKLNNIMSTQSEIAQGLTNLTTQVAKIGEESKVTIQKLADLEAAINNAPVTPELQAAFDALKAQVTIVDDLIPDVVPPTV